MKLYELENAYISLLQMIDDEEFTEEDIADTLEAIAGEIEIKADNIACMLKGIEADMSAIRAEEIRLATRRKAKERAYERIKQFLSDTLQRMSIDKVETARNKITFRKSESVELDEAAFIEWAKNNRDDLLKYSEPTADKTAIKSVLNDGEKVVGAKLISKNNIQIK